MNSEYDKLNDAIARVSAHPEQMSDFAADAELYELLQTAQLGMHLPTNSVPRPVKRYKFQLVHKTRIFGARLFMQLAGGGLAAIVFVSVAAWSSVPGQKIFAIKKAMEQTRLELIRDPGQRALAQVSLVQKRMNEVQTVLSSDNTNEQAKVAALNELASQTQNASESVKVAASTDAGKPAVDSSLLESLGQIAQKQEALLATISTGDGKAVDTTVTEPISKTKTAVAEVKKILATVNEQTMASLPTEEPLTITGIAIRVTDTVISIDKKIITIVPETKIFLKDEKTPSDSKNLDKKKVRITVQDTDALAAEKIIILDAPAVKGETTKPAAKPVTPKPEVIVDPTTIIQEQNRVQSGYILEDPAQTFNP
jgi:hypothetical protein